MAPTCPVWDVTSTRPSASGVSDVGADTLATDRSAKPGGKPVAAATGGAP